MPPATAKSAIRAEIEAAASASQPAMMPLIQQELDLMESVEDIDGKGTILDKLHGIWKNNKGKCGHVNKVNSRTAYAIGLTDVCPKLGDFLPLRRCFARRSFPDVDSDFDDDRRDELIDYLVQQYGRDKVGNIGTYQQMHLKSVVRSLIKVLDIGGGFFKGKEDYKTLNKLKGDEIVGSLPEPQGSKLIWTDPETGKVTHIKTVADATANVPRFRDYMEQFPEVLTLSKDLEGLNSNFSVHASGVVISNHPLAELAPMRPAKEKTVWDEKTQKEITVQSYATQFSMDDCEAIGLIKFDILAIKTLAVIRQALELIQQKYNIIIDPENVTLTDRRTFNLYKTGNLVGCFQVENYGMQKTCKEMDVSSFEDIMAAIALYRPGPMINIPKYVQRKKGLEPIDYFHSSIAPFVKEFLEKTYGICVYQEQIMQVCMAIGGLSITDGYGVIKGVGKKKLDELAKYRTQFVAGAVLKGIPREVAEQYWDKFIIPFADYGFNAAHSCCYGYNSYLTTYLKANYKEEFMCASLNVEAIRKKWVKVWKLERDCKDRNNFKLAKRNLNTCGLKYVIEQWANPDKEQGAIIRPSILCKGLSKAAAVEIVGKAPFQNLRDFATRCSKVVDNSSVEALAEAGFFSQPEYFVKQFATIREDLKKALKKNVPSGDMFE